MPDGVKVLSEEGSFDKTKGDWRKHKIGMVLGFFGVLLLTVVTFISVNQTQQLSEFSYRSQASDGTTYSRPIHCDRCDRAGGSQHCRERFETKFNLLPRTNTGWLASLYAKRAFALALRDDPATTNTDERDCGSCDLSPQSGKNFGNRVMDQADVDMYNNVCIPPSPTPTPIIIPTSIPTTAPQLSCSSCDFNGDGIFSQNEAQQLSNCYFNPSTVGCPGRDPNSDGSLGAADITWCVNRCAVFTPTPTPTPQSAVDCRGCDFNGDDQFTAEPDGTELAACYFVTGVQNCLTLDINSDRMVDAGDASAFNICIGNITNGQLPQFGRGCDVNRDGNYNAGDTAFFGSRFMTCVSNLAGHNKCATDPNSDGQLNAADPMWCSLHCAPTPTPQ